MKTAFQAFFKQRTTWIGVGAAVMFQLVFGLVWMTGYDGVSDRMNELKAAIVADPQAAPIVQTLANQLPIEIVPMEQLQAAQDALQSRDIQMILHLQMVSNADANGGAMPKIQLTTYINEANASMLKSMMTSISAKVEEGLSHAQLQQAAAASGNEALAALLQSTSVDAQTVVLNEAGGMNRQMIPLMMVLASYVGAMLMALNLEQSAQAVAPAIGRWRRFIVRVIMNLSTAIVVSAFGTSLVALLGGAISGGAWQLFAFQTVLVAVFMFTAQMFVLLFGQGGMVFNIILLSVQLVTSGAMVARPLLSNGYRVVSDWLPATYGVDGIMNILFGGTGTSADMSALLTIGLIVLIVGAAAVAIRRDHTSVEQSSRLEAAPSTMS